MSHDPLTLLRISCPSSDEAAPSKRLLSTELGKGTVLPSRRGTGRVPEPSTRKPGSLEGERSERSLNRKIGLAKSVLGFWSQGTGNSAFCLRLIYTCTIRA